MWRAVPKPLSPRIAKPLLLVVAVALVLAAAGCSAEADLVAYFASPPPTVSPTSGPSAPGESPSAQPTAAAPAPSPSASPAPTPEPGATATPAWSPLPTRPPGLAEFSKLREQAASVSVDQLSAQPSRYGGETVYFEGRVNDLDQAGNQVRVRMKIGNSFVYLLYRTDRYFGDHPLVRNDSLKLIGRFIGMSGSSTAENLPELEIIDILHKFT